MITALLPRKDADMARKKAFFAKRLKELRLQAGLTQDKLADRSGLALSTIKLFEQGWREPTFATLVKLTAGLGVPLGAFEPQRRKQRDDS